MLLLALTLLQQVPVVRLDRPTAAPRETFTKVTGLVELPDGRLLVADEEERRIVLLDPRNSATTPVSRTGSGPREFRSIANLFPRPDGGAWLVDFAQKRLLPIRPDGKAEDVIAIPPSLLLAAVDGGGRIYADIFGKFVNGTTSDSMTVVRWTPPSARYDTLMMRNANWSTRITRGGQPRPVLAPFDAHVVLSSGDVVTFEAATYRVTRWRDGKRVVSNDVAWKPVPVTDAEKEAYLSEEAGQKTTSLSGGPSKKGGGASSGPPPGWKDAGKIWPTNKPAFVDDDVHVSSDGRIWVRLYTSHRERAGHYDVLDENGRLVGKVTTAPGTTVAGFGKGVVYLSEKNDDDELLIRRYALPKFGP